MLDELRQRMAAFLAAHQVGVLSAAGTEGAWLMPVRCRLTPGRSLTVDCLLPAWADAAYFLEQDPRVMLVILDPPSSPLAGETGGGLRWLQIQGAARAIVAPDWTGWPTRWASAAPPDALYRVVQVTPARMDLFDEGLGWGARETLDWCCASRDA